MRNSVICKKLALKKYLVEFLIWEQECNVLLIYKNVKDYFYSIDIDNDGRSG